jgi:hypothetical protein
LPRTVRMMAVLMYFEKRVYLDWIHLFLGWKDT